MIDEAGQSHGVLEFRRVFLVLGCLELVGNEVGRVRFQDQMLQIESFCHPSLEEVGHKAKLHSGEEQAWSLTQFLSASVSQSRIMWYG